MKLKYILILSGILLTLSSCNKVKNSNYMDLVVKENGPSIFVATDLHYLSRELTDNSAAFREFIKGGDGKIVEYTPDITDALIDEVIKAHPKALIISGDLTFNGEKKSHKELSEKLKTVKRAGIHVLVIPGNHDILNPHSYQYKGNKVYTTTNITPEDFKSLYEDMGYKDALDSDPDSLSYLYEIADDLWVIMLDANKDMGYAIDSGRISDTSFAWIRQCLEKAKKEGATVISVTHQNLLSHNELFTSRYTILNGIELTKLLEEYQVKLNLSGHMHIQDIQKSENENGIYDIVTSSLAVYPNHYGIVHISPDRKITYQSKNVNVNEYARNNHSKDENLLNFDNYGRQFFFDSSYEKIYHSLEEADITEDKQKAMAEYAADINIKYFSGALKDTLKEDLGKVEYDYWMEEGKDTFFGTYLKSILNQKSEDENKVILK